MKFVLGNVIFHTSTKVPIPVFLTQWNGYIRQTHNSLEF